MTILALALMPPGGSRLVLAQHEIVARGPLMDPGTHPEWRQFLIQAALRRAGELERLRELRDTVVPVPEIQEPDIEAVTEAPAASPKVAGLPSGAAHGDEEDEVTGSIVPDPSATIPIEIGEASSTELPVIAIEDTPPTMRVPALQMPSLEPAAPAAIEPPAIETPAIAPPAAGRPAKKVETRQRAVQQRARRKPPTPAEPQPLPPPFNILAAIFGSFAKAESSAQTSPPVNRQAPMARTVIR